MNGKVLGSVRIPYETIDATECPDCGFDSVTHTIVHGPAAMTVWSSCGRCEDDD